MAGAAPASADVFLGISTGIETNANANQQAYADPHALSLRALGGGRFGDYVALEAIVNRFGVDTSRGERTAYQLGFGLKGFLPLGHQLEGFARAGLERTTIDTADNNHDLSGDGYLIGIGVAYRLDQLRPDAAWLATALEHASIFVDYTYHYATLDSLVIGHIDPVTLGNLGVGLIVGL